MINDKTGKIIKRVGLKTSFKHISIKIRFDFIKQLPKHDYIIKYFFKKKMTSLISSVHLKFGNVALASSYVELKHQFRYFY